MEEKARLRNARGLTRSQAAELLGITEHEISRMDGRQLHPFRTDDRRYLYDIADLRGILLRSSGQASGGRPVVSGETTAAVFELFEAQKTLPQVLIATKQTAETVMHLRAEYDRMVDSTVLPPGTMPKLREVIGRFEAENLVEAVRTAIDRSFHEGRDDVLYAGEVLDPKTGKMRRIPTTVSVSARPNVAADASPQPDQEARLQPIAPDHGGTACGVPGATEQAPKKE